MTTTIRLPAAAAEQLPESYMAARAALAQCQRVDECRKWADRAAALATSVKQVEDQALETTAQRIRARAIRRAGELLRQVEPGQAPSRGEVAKAAGFSHHQAKQALRVAAVPAADFERQVESPTPSTITELAREGKRARPGRQPCLFSDPARRRPQGARP